MSIYLFILSKRQLHINSFKINTLIFVKKKSGFVDKDSLFNVMFKRVYFFNSTPNSE